MGSGSFLSQALIYLTAAVLSVPLAKRIGLGSVLGYLVAGIAIGPFLLGLVGEEGQDVMHFAEFGVVMMLFLIGLELRPSLLWRMRGPIVGLGGLQVGVTAVLITLVALVAGLEWRGAIAVGMVLSLSSTAIVLQTLSEKGLLRTAAGQHSFSVLLFQDIAVIPMLALLPLLAAGTGTGHGGTGGHGPAHGASFVTGLPAWGQVLVVSAAVATIFVTGRFIVQPAFRMIAATRLRELLTAAALLVVVAAAALMTAVGLSPALGTFLAGVVLAGSEYRHELETDIEPFKGLLLGLFFIAVGASIDFRLVGAAPGRIALIVTGLLIVKFVVLFVLGRAFRLGLDQNLLFSLGLAQSGEFAFVLFSFAAQDGVLERALTNELVAVVALSMALTPLLMLVNEKLLQPRFGTREREEREPDAIESRSPVIIAGFGRFGHIVGRLLLANGVRATVLDVDSDQVDMLRKLGLEVYYGDACRPELLEAAGAQDARMFVVAVDDPGRARDIVETVRRHFPHLEILARARGRADAYELLDAGVDRVYRETLDSSLRLGIDALRLLGMPAYPAWRAARRFRRHDEQSVRELAAMRHDRKAYVGRARELIREMTEIMSEEQRGRSAERDAAWDSESLRREYGGPGSA
jgi:monovalent cation:proton antiporter-2 (CPA2) family protein